MSSPSRPVVLVKVSAAGDGRAPVGERFQTRAPADATFEASVERAWRQFAREHPDENPMCWAVSTA